MRFRAASWVWEDGKRRVVLKGFLLFLQLMMLFSIIDIIEKRYSILPEEYSVNLALNCLGIFISVIIYFSILRNDILESGESLLPVLVFLSTLYMYVDAVFWAIDGIPELALWNIVINTIYILCPAWMTLTFWQLLGILIENRSVYYEKTDKIMKGVTLFLHFFAAGNLLFGYHFSISLVTGIYSRGNAYNVQLVMVTVMLVNYLICILLCRMPVTDKLIFLSYPLLPYINFILRAGKTGPSLLSVETFCSITFFYTNLYVRKGRESIQKEKTLMESRLQALQMQINPHFLYNTLGSAASLCEDSPEDAQEMIFLLSDYLHDNFSDISVPSMIPFQDELTHLKHYLSIESMRFPNIRFHYDIQFSEFYIPRMILQPLAENAIKHGICKRRKSEGNLYISTGETENAWEISLQDDGVGFTELPQTGRHIGIENVRTRLQILCNGTLEVYSVPGKGTTSRIILPKDTASKSE